MSAERLRLDFDAFRLNTAAAATSTPTRQASARGWSASRVARGSTGRCPWPTDGLCPSVDVRVALRDAFGYDARPIGRRCDVLRSRYIC